MFNASASYGIDGPVVQYNWDFGDGTEMNVTSAGTTHVYATSTSLVVGLIVVDSTGQSSSPAKSAYATTPGRVLEKHSPFAAFYSSEQGADVGEVVTFYGNASYATNGTLVSYTWDFGDGTGNTTLPTPAVTHSFSSEGIFTVKLAVTDNDGLSGFIYHPERIGALRIVRSQGLSPTQYVLIGVAVAGVAGVAAVGLLRRMASLKREEAEEIRDASSSGVVGTTQDWRAHRGPI